jgi:DNA-directed RNA polymerase subunit RPC12/RpoP
MSTRRQRYLARRGQLVDEVRYDLAKPHEPQPAPEAKPAAEATLEEISKGIDTSSLEQVGSLDELESLADLQSLEKISDVDLSNLGGLAEIQEIEKPKGAGCPRCSAMHSTVVYCPYCGKGFCSNCSSKVQAKQEMVFYACPSCSKEVIVRKEG